MNLERMFGSVTTMTDTFRCGHPKSPENTAPNGAGTACRECARARQRAAYRANLDAARESARARMVKHRRAKGVQEGHASTRVTHCPQGHEYTPENTYITPAGYRQCKTCRRVRVRETFERRGDVYLERQRERYAADPERYLAANREWAKANPEKVSLVHRVKRQRKRAAGNLTAADWRAVLKRYGTLCLCCGSSEPPTIDHVIPLSRGGSNTVDNVQPLCNTCNMRKGTKTIDYRPPGAVASEGG